MRNLNAACAIYRRFFVQFLLWTMRMKAANLSRVKRDKPYSTKLATTVTTQTPNGTFNCATPVDTFASDIFLSAIQEDFQTF
jgi:hypothetical protein